jgi:hypothetical protein
MRCVDCGAYGWKWRKVHWVEDHKPIALSASGGAAVCICMCATEVRLQPMPAQLI